MWEFQDLGGKSVNNCKILLDKQGRKEGRMSLQGLSLAFWWQQKEDNSAFGSAEEQGPALLWRGTTETRASYRHRPVCMAPACPTHHQQGMRQSPHLMCLWDYTGKREHKFPEVVPLPCSFPGGPKTMANGINRSYCEMKVGSEQEILRPHSDMQSTCRFKKPFFERIKLPKPI